MDGKRVWLWLMLPSLMLPQARQPIVPANAARVPPLAAIPFPSGCRAPRAQLDDKCVP